MFCDNQITTYLVKPLATTRLMMKREFLNIAKWTLCYFKVEFGKTLSFRIKIIHKETLVKEDVVR